MNTSFGPRIDADRWDFHDGIDLPAPVEPVKM
jgi:murein DD-endopeptidase MepM/ murein hydrolase activator NlpD